MVAFTNSVVFYKCQLGQKFPLRKPTAATEARTVHVGPKPKGEQEDHNADNCALILYTLCRGVKIAGGSDSLSGCEINRCHGFMGQCSTTTVSPTKANAEPKFLLYKVLL